MFAVWPRLCRRCWAVCSTTEEIALAAYPQVLLVVGCCKDKTVAAPKVYRRERVCLGNGSTLAIPLGPCFVVMVFLAGEGPEGGRTDSQPRRDLPIPGRR